MAVDTTDTLRGRLSRDQKAALKAVESARRSEQLTVEDTKLNVLKAISKGVPVRVMAESLGVSLQRVYQMRDEAQMILETRQKR